MNSDTWLQSLSSSQRQLDARLTLAQQEAISPIVTLLVRDGLKMTIDTSQLTDQQIGVILKIFQEAHQSGKLDAFLKQYMVNANDIHIRKRCFGPALMVLWDGSGRGAYGPGRPDRTG